MKKVLFVASVTGHITAFHIPFMKSLKEKGCVVNVASKGKREIPFRDAHYEIGFERNPFKFANLSAYNELKKIIKENNYDIIHCHTPVAAFLTRMAARKKRKKGTKVIYTAHGFHFFKGAPIINWLVYFPVEWISSFFTDVLITINKEDYNFANKYMCAKQVEYVPGVGLDIEKIEKASADRKLKREDLGIEVDEIAVLSVGELNDNKNHETIIKAIAQLKERKFCYIICGKGAKDNYLKELAKELGVKLVLAGFRKDIAEICKCCDVFAFPSKREGLPVSVMEAMAAGLPIVCSDIRGSKDLVEEGVNGFLCNPLDADGFATKIRKLADDEQLCKKMSEESKVKISGFCLTKVQKEMSRIYSA